MADSKMRVKQISFYPLKSLRGVSPPTHLATYAGLLHDRRFMFQRVSDNKNIAIAKETEMCLFTTHVPGEGDDADVRNGGSKVGNEGVLTEIEVRYTISHAFAKPGQKVSAEPLRVPLDPDISGLKEVDVVMHHSPTVGYDMGSKYNKWFSERFGYDVRLLYIGGNKRKVLGNMPPNIAGRQRESGTRGEGLENTADAPVTNGGGGGWLGTITGAVRGVLGGENKENREYDGVDQGLSFADVAPYLVINQKSWENAQRRLPADEAMDITKFRPNIIVEGADEEFEEDYWGEIEIGEKAVIVLTQNCARCNSLNVDYGTGKVGEGESGKILKKLQTDRRVDEGAKWSPIFGRYGFLKRVDGDENGVRISVGDEVRVVRRNEARTRFEWPNLSTN